MTQSPPAPLPWYRSPAVVMLLFVGVALLAYAPAIGAWYIWDDDLWIVNNVNLRSFQGLIDTWFAPRTNPEYYPLTLSVFWAEYQLWGLHPTGYHVVNILLHAVNAFLVWRVLTRLRVPGAWLAAAIYLLHPVNVETVAWVTEHKNTISGIMLALSVLAFIRAFGLDRDEPRPLARWWLAASIGFYVLAVLAKTVAVTLPGVLLVILWWKNRLTWRGVLAVWPYVVLGLPLAGFAVWMQHVHTGASTHSANGIEFAFTFPQRLLIASQAPWFYLSKLVWPWPLAFVYPKWELAPAQWWRFGGLVATAGLLITLAALRNRIGRGPLAAFLIYGGMLLPAMGFFNVFWFRYTFVADHVQYHASVAMIALGAAGVVKVLFKNAERNASRSAISVQRAALIGLLMVLGTLTFLQSRYYYDNERLMRRTAELNPHNQFPYGNLGYALHAKGRFGEAAEAFREALKYTPPVPYRQSRAHYWLGHSLESDGRPTEAIPAYQQAVAVDPSYVGAHYNLANCLRQAGRYPEAIEHYRRTIKLEPGHVYAHNNLAYTLLLAGRLDEAIAAYEATLRLAPDLGPAHAGLRQARLRQQQNPSR